MELSVPGFTEAPFAYCGSIYDKKYIEVCVRRAGELTNRMHEMKVGDVVGIRGPYGNGWPIDKIKNKKVLIVAGGIGIIPFRSLIKSYCSTKSGNMQIFYGAREKDELIFKNEINDWCKNIEVNITLDKEKEEPYGSRMGNISGIACNIGLITTLFDKTKVDAEGVALVCGPPIMCKFVVNKLKEKGFKDKDLYLSLERRMECGLGICEHCAVGPYYVCKDGPVFSWEQLRDVKDVI
jgi:NAD(P)H-flavin reductase